MIIEFDEPAEGEDPLLGIENVLENLLTESAGNLQRLQDILHAAGHDVDGARQPQQQKEGGGNANSDTDGAETRKQKKDEDARTVQHVELWEPKIEKHIIVVIVMIRVRVHINAIPEAQFNSSGSS